jgi:hypothetical protein
MDRGVVGPAVVGSAPDRFLRSRRAGLASAAAGDNRTHLRNIFHKINVTSRVGLARVIEHADRTTGISGRQ